MKTLILRSITILSGAVLFSTAMFFSGKVRAQSVDVTVGGNKESFPVDANGATLTFLPNPQDCKYRGNELVLIEKIPAGFAPGSVVSFDFNNTGTFSNDVTTDAKGLFTTSIDMTGLPQSTPFAMKIVSHSPDTTMTMKGIATRTSATDPSSSLPTTQSTLANEPGTCTCVACALAASSMTMIGDGGLYQYSQTATPQVADVQLCDGKLHEHFPVMHFATRELGFNFALDFASLVAYDGVVGPGMSFSYNMMIVQTSAKTARIITPDLRMFNITSTEGLQWALPDGFNARLTLDPNLHRWSLVHYSGFAVTFYQAALNNPGYPLWISEPNGNTATLRYDKSGYLRQVITDLGQVERIAYDTSGHMISFTDHIGRTWSLLHDAANHLTDIVEPPTSFLNLPVNALATLQDASNSIETRPDTMQLTWTDASHPNALTSIIDARGANVRAYTYDASGRTQAVALDGNPISIVFQPSSSPTPLTKLEPSNLIVRVIDRVGNSTDYEIHSDVGGPLSGEGKYGIRRKVQWTEAGKGNTALRVGDPPYYEQRWLQECDCLSPRIVTEPFTPLELSESQPDSLGIPAFGIARTIDSYNANRQVISEVRTDGRDTIKSVNAYQDGSYGVSGMYSRRISHVGPDQYDHNQFNAGLNFVESFQYDAKGNLTSHSGPTVTRGVSAPLTITETYAYNEFGQLVSVTDANQNKTTLSFFSGPSSGGGINAQGTFGGYLSSKIVGANGSTDSAAQITEQFKVNALGMVTQHIDPNGNLTTLERNAHGQVTIEHLPQVTIDSGSKATVIRKHYYDAAGHELMTTVVHPEGGEYIEAVYALDALGNVTAERHQVDADPTHDQISRYAYDLNDRQIASQRPMGNRTFTIRDERNLPLRDFSGVVPGTSPTDGYPTSKLAQTLSVGFLSSDEYSYDSRGNLIKNYDGLHRLKTFVYDFANRRIATIGPSGNGLRDHFDAAGHIVLIERGGLDVRTGNVSELTSRTYMRYDEAGRQYLTTHDANLATDESQQIDPTATGSQTTRTIYDAAGRMRTVLDPKGNQRNYLYDAAGRILSITNGLANQRIFTYDQNSNNTQVKKVDIPSQIVGSPEYYVERYEYDEWGRPIAAHDLVKLGSSSDLVTHLVYNSIGTRRIMITPNKEITVETSNYLGFLMGSAEYFGTVSPVNQLADYRRVYDKNNRLTQEVTFGNVSDATTAQVTKYAYDNLDRKIRDVYPDSDDPIDGSGNGADGVYNRIERTYDAANNLVRMVDQRQVTYVNQFDSANKIVQQDVQLANGVYGRVKVKFYWDREGRQIAVENNYARVSNIYNALSEMTSESELIKLDGTGFTNGWEDQIQIANQYDLDGNRIAHTVIAGGHTDLAVQTTYDSINRVSSISAGYFNRPMHSIAHYGYLGARTIVKTLGDGLRLTNTFDEFQRMTKVKWTGIDGSMLTAFDYSYDSVDNMVAENFEHDQNLNDDYTYDHRNQLVGAQYRYASATPPSPTSNSFSYNQVFQRTQAVYGDPFGLDSALHDRYISNNANEITAILRGALGMTVPYDRAGNMLQVPTRPASGNTTTPIGIAWDADDQPYLVHSNANDSFYYFYDGLGRRVAEVQVTQNFIAPTSHRYVYNGWTDIEERAFVQGSTLQHSASVLERIYVSGPQPDEFLLSAADMNHDGSLTTAKNQPNATADKEYYFTTDRMGSTMAIVDADNLKRVLEYYRYSAYGSPTVLPIVDLNNDGLEDTPTDLTDNAALRMRYSANYGNSMLFTGRRYIHNFDLYEYRNRYYAPDLGVFLSRDPIGYWTSMNLSDYCRNAPRTYVDPSGLDIVTVSIFDDTFFFFTTPDWGVTWTLNTAPADCKESGTCTWDITSGHQTINAAASAAITTGASGSAKYTGADTWEVVILSPTKKVTDAGKWIYNKPCTVTCCTECNLQFAVVHNSDKEGTVDVTVPGAGKGSTTVKVSGGEVSYGHIDIKHCPQNAYWQIDGGLDPGTIPLGQGAGKMSNEGKIRPSTPKAEYKASVK